MCKSLQRKRGWNDAWLQSAEWRQEDEQVRRKENVNKGEGLTQSQGTFASIFLLFSTFFAHFQWQSEQRVWESWGTSDTYLTESLFTKRWVVLSSGRQISHTETAIFYEIQRLMRETGARQDKQLKQGDSCSNWECWLVCFIDSARVQKQKGKYEIEQVI